MQTVALICGITGQDGALLARFLLEKGYRVWGTSRNADTASTANLVSIGIADRITLVSMDPEIGADVIKVIRDSQAVEIYHLAAQSSVGRSFERPVETVSGIVLGTLNVLEAVRTLGNNARVFVAGSGECFGDTGQEAADETTPFNPGSPYAVAKASAYWLTRNYRESYGLFACTGLLFNHESPLRPERFVTQKILRAAKRISDGSGERLRLGRLDIQRDWGWAPEYVEAMWRMLQHADPEDFVIATGSTHPLREFVAEAFAAFGLDWEQHVTEAPELYRPSDILLSCANPEKARRLLGWKAKFSMRDVVRLMTDSLAGEA
ncbi:MAG: GDP-mannose 4,6-dehydratase [Rhodocyclaceae bacterium]|nr:GDP-mannose 4,6-dehydratase [Rhodocyclaceae bacterium]